MTFDAYHRYRTRPRTTARGCAPGANGRAPPPPPPPRRGRGATSAGTRAPGNKSH